MSIGTHIKALLKERKIKQIALAKYLGMSPSRLSNYLSDKREPGFETIHKIAEYFNINMEYFAAGVKSKNINYPVQEEVIHSDTLKSTATVPYKRIHAKVRSRPERMVEIDPFLLGGLDLSSLVIFKITANMDGIFSKGDHVLAVRMADYEPANNDTIIETGRNGRAYTFWHYDGKPLITSNTGTIAEIEPERRSKLYIVLKHIKNKINGGRYD